MFFKEDMSMANRNMKRCTTLTSGRNSSVWESIRPKMLNITSHQGNANQNHNDVSPHTCQDAHHHKEHGKCWLGCGTNRNLIRCRLESKMVQTFANCLAFFQIELNYTQIESIYPMALKFHSYSKIPI